MREVRRPDRRMEVRDLRFRRAPARRAPSSLWIGST